MPKPAKDAGAALCRKGFQSHQSDHVYYYFYANGRKTAVRTKISHGEKEIGDNLLAVMARQVKLTKKLFGELVDCSMTQEQYLRKLRDAGHIGKTAPSRDD